MAKKDSPEFIIIRKDYEKAIAMTLETLSSKDEDKIQCIAVVAIVGEDEHIAFFWNASTYDKLTLAGILQMEAINEQAEPEEGEEETDEGADS